MTDARRAALARSFLVALYAITGHPEHSEVAYVRLLCGIVLHGGAGGVPS